MLCGGLQGNLNISRESNVFGGEMPVKRAKGACGHGSCKKKEKLSKCKYCKKLYCQVHINPLMPGAEKSEKGHVCPLAYEDAAREVVAEDKGKVRSLENKLEKSGKEVAIEADWVIGVKTDKDIELVKETMLGSRDKYRGILVDIHPELDIEKKNQIMKWLTEFAKENNWNAEVYSDTKIHFTPPTGADSGRLSLWDKFVNWLKD
jgi:hypothetical protein